MQDISNPKFTFPIIYALQVKSIHHEKQPRAVELTNCLLKTITKSHSKTSLDRPPLLYSLPRPPPMMHSGISLNWAFLPPGGVARANWICHVAMNFWKLRWLKLKFFFVFLSFKTDLFFVFGRSLRRVSNRGVSCYTQDRFYLWRNDFTQS